MGIIGSYSTDTSLGKDVATYETALRDYQNKATAYNTQVGAYNEWANAKNEKARNPGFDEFGGALSPNLTKQIPVLDANGQQVITPAGVDENGTAFPARPQFQSVSWDKPALGAAPTQPNNPLTGYSDQEIKKHLTAKAGPADQERTAVSPNSVFGTGMINSVMPFK